MCVVKSTLTNTAGAYIFFSSRANIKSMVHGLRAMKGFYHQVFLQVHLPRVYLCSLRTTSIYELREYVYKT